MAYYLLAVAGTTPQFLNNVAHVLNGGKLYFYVAGTVSTPLTTYIDNIGSDTNTQPIVLDSNGKLTTSVWVVGGSEARIELYDANDVIQGTWDYIPGINDPTSTGGGGTDQWVDSGVTPTYLSSSQFSVPGNMTTEFAVGTRVRYDVTAGTFYGVVTARSFSTNTTVTILADSSGLDSGLSAVAYGIITVVNGSLDAAAVRYTSSITYNTNNVGGQIQLVPSLIEKKFVVTTTTGTGSAYVLSPDPAPTAYSTTQVFFVYFHAAGSGTPTLNVNSLGALNLKYYNLGSGGSKSTYLPPINTVAVVMYDGTDFIVVDPVYPSASSALPFSTVIKTTVETSTWTVPAEVTFAEVTCVGGGGGGGSGGSSGGESPTSFSGGTGGQGGVAVKLLAVTPGASLAYTVGAGGAGGTISNGSAGSNTTFGSSDVIATGGAGGAGAGSTTNGANGYDLVSDYGYTNPPMTVTGSLKGAGGAGGLGVFGSGTAGTSGMIIIKAY